MGELSKIGASLDFPALAAEWVRALRGRRSQAGFSRWLGYRSSVVHRWERGEAWPTAARFLEACQRAGRDVRVAYGHFFHQTPDWLGPHAADSREGVAALLRRLRGETKLGDLAQQSGHSRYAVARWLSGKAEPKLPEFLALIEASTRRTLDFVATLQDPAELPSARDRWQRLVALRRSAFEETWSHAVLRAFELAEYEQVVEVRPWLCMVLGIERDQVDRALAVLEQTGQIEPLGERWAALPATAVTAERDPALLGALTGKWTEVALERSRKHASGHSGYSLFAVSRQDLRRLRDLQLEYLREMQAIVARSSPSECVGLLCLHLMDLRAGQGNALR